MKSKKGAEGIMWTVVIIALLLLFLLIYSGVLGKLYNKLFSGTNDQINSANDFDNDGVANFADKCPCNDKGTIENSGCPDGYTPKDNEDKSCLNKKT